MKTILFLLLTIPVFSQKLHHQMLSSQGGNATTSSGVVFKVPEVSLIGAVFAEAVPALM